MRLLHSEIFNETYQRRMALLERILIHADTVQTINKVSRLIADMKTRTPETPDTEDK